MGPPDYPLELCASPSKKSRRRAVNSYNIPVYNIQFFPLLFFDPLLTQIALSVLRSLIRGVFGLFSEIGFLLVSSRDSHISWPVASIFPCL